MAPLQLRVAVLGDPSVGKTALCRALTHTTADGPEFSSQNVHKGLDIALTLSECSGDSACPASDVVLICFDCCERATLDAARRWHEVAAKARDATGRGAFVTILVGTKLDLFDGKKTEQPEQVRVLRRQAREIAAEIGEKGDVPQ